MLFNSSERKGVLILLFLITAIIVLPRQFLRKDHDFFLLQEVVPVSYDSLILQHDSILNIHQPGQRPKLTAPPIELNTADSNTLVSIRGIGPYYASKILRYRERLGGFHSIKQLKEVNMTYFNVDSLAHLFTVRPELITRRELDTMSFKAILRHPYLEYEDVKLIFNAKRKYKAISYSLLEEKNVLPTDKLKKLKPYFK